MDESTVAQGGSLQILLLLVMSIPAVLFLLTQYNTIKLIRKENRLLSPGAVWLQLIPILGFICQFFIINRIAKSLRNEILARSNDDSIMGISDTRFLKVIASKQLPTYGIGISATVLLIGSFLSQAFVPSGLLLIAGLLSLAAMTCWIIYWVQLAGYKRRLKQTAF